MPTATQYADWVVDYCATELGAPTDPMSLEKQLYYAQGFSLALRGEPLFQEDFEAWTYGPVVRSVWDRYSGSSPITQKAHHIFSFSGNPRALVLDESTREYLTDLIAFLGRLNALELSRATHNESPWNEARDGLGPRDKSSGLIAKTAMRDYYGTLIEEGENALSRRALLADLPSPRWGWSFVAGICARRMVMHPFYFHGLSLWGTKSRLGDGPMPRPEVDPALYKPLTRQQAEDVESFSSIGELIASMKTQ
ncbi:MAG: type II toxin-antitoxin system antitoxin SocA domain-containing protein [Rhizomicrobium sp.]